MFIGLTPTKKHLCCDDEFILQKKNNKNIFSYQLKESKRSRNDH